MSKAGLVHRDVSAGNSLFYEGRGILSGLEYAKEYGKISASDSRTGTPDFMAVEYQAKTYLFLPEMEMPVTAGANGSDLMEPPFIRNPVHDLESVFWQYLWFLHYRMPRNLVTQQKPSELLKALSDVSGSAYNLFSYGIEGNTTREHLITLSRGSSNRSLLKSLILINGVELLESDELTGRLRNEYKRVEEATPELVNDRLQIPIATFQSDDIYNTFKGYFQRTLNHLEQLEGGNLSVEDSSVARGRLIRAQTGASTPPGSLAAGSSRRSTCQTLSTSAGKSRGLSHKRSSTDARLDDRAHQEQETSRSLKKRQSSQQAVSIHALRPRASASNASAAPNKPNATGKAKR
ncbi:hypothetical protein PENSPDRAFT_758831 [Peniophora sp. CONT]|nr:hypothetical protein PENSPDRAFT_758831 [Peniophora sp. CONT]